MLVLIHVRITLISLRIPQALMELVLALKKALRSTEGRVAPATLSSKEIMYVQGREGPQLCSLVNLTRKSVLDDMFIKLSTFVSLVCRGRHCWLLDYLVLLIVFRSFCSDLGTAYQCSVADVCVRSGKWYYEVEVTKMPRATSYLNVSIGWLSAKATTNVALQYQLGGDSTGQSWGYNVAQQTFCQNGGTCSVVARVVNSLFPVPRSLFPFRDICSNRSQHP